MIGYLQDPTNRKSDANGRAATESLELKHWISTFWDYPQEQGWTTDDPVLHWYQCSNAVAAARAQEWLYFHLLEGFLGVYVSIDKLSRRSTHSGKMVIDSSIIPQLIHEWESRARDPTETKAEDEKSSIKDGYTVLRLLMEVIQACRNLDEHDEPSRSISLSIRILVETLAKAVSGVSKGDAMEQYTTWKLGPTPVLTDRMANMGWCRFQIARLWYQYLPSTMYYLSSLPDRLKFGAVTHENCTADHCTSTGVDPVTYEPRHRQTCLSTAANENSCSMVDVDTNSIADVILQDSFPLIEIQAQPDGIIELKIHKYTLGMPFVALSHVWSGGMGNVNTNSMRLCQLRYLHSLLQRIRENGDDDLDRRYGSRKIDDGIEDFRVRLGFARKEKPLLLWIDTLCVPVGAEYKAAYTMTLRRMAQIYVSAQCVLVMDPELQHMNHGAMQKEQVFAHILCSAWMCRSWCFQEASLARIYLIQFNDGYYVVDQQYFQFLKDSEQHSPSIESDRALADVHSAGTDTLISPNSLMREVSRWFWETPVVMKIRSRDPRQLMNKLEDWKNFALAWNGLRNRSTTKAEDLYGILAVVVDLSAGDVLKIHPADRLKAIYRSQSTLPLPLLYQVGPKIQDENGRDTWAPSIVRGDRLDLHAGYCTVGLEGLSLDPSRWADLSAPQAVLITCAPTFHRPLGIELPKIHTRLMIEFVSGQTCPVTEDFEYTLCCIYDDSLLHHVPGIGTFSPGVCVIVNSQVNDVFDVSYLCPIRVFSPQNSKIATSSLLGRETDELHIVGRSLDWQKHSILIKSDFDRWPSPLRHVSRRALSTKVIIRNSSNWIDLSSIGLVSGPYMIGIIICAIHRQNQLPGKLLWLCVSRWLSLLIEAAWALASLAQWDRYRTLDWTDRLYGTTAKPRVQRLKHLSQYPAFIARVPPLAAASTFLGLYHKHRGSTWMKVFAIILFAEVGLHLAFTLVTLQIVFLYVSHGWWEPVTRTFFSDLPEDPVEVSTKQSQLRELDWRPEVDHRYRIAILVWRMVDQLRRKEQVSENSNRIISVA